MKNSTIRLIVILATLCITGITITQLYWVRRAFDLKEAEFERTVTAALYNVAQEIYEVNNTPSPSNNPVKQVSTNYFVVMVNSEVNARLLEFLLRTEFEKRNIVADFEYGIYDCTNEKMAYGNYVPLKSKQKNIASSFPKWSTHGYYFGVQFPNREAHIINQMGIWSFSSVVLLLVIVFFAYTLFVILKQKRLSEVQKDFINNMTHEFKTPISTIAVSTEVLKNPTIIQHPERLLNYATIIEKENLRLKQQVERVLQMARLDKEDVGLKKENVEIQQLVQDAIRNTTVALNEKKGKVNEVFEAGELGIQADKLHITNVLANLLDNAVKYCKDEPEITIRTSRHEKGVMVEVQDNGIGISSEHHKRVFQKFYRVPTGNIHDVKGFGLGLSYVKTIIEAHGGSITLQSEPGKGSLFRFYLPV
ncbi:sensor histidine kinase [Ohtaekwangia sp.]|uniref:sensor histidine kinase n=1 Tax=Ohtaekwangia sp. TaxID=2066019 RepID=UPI002FDEB8C8